MLYIVATPIGNLEDITLRALRILREADFVACEDTRHTGILLQHYDIQKSLISFHQHSKLQKIDLIIEKLKDGQNIALVTDAGTPGIADPGGVLIAEALKHNIEIEGIPGPDAATLLLSQSGISTDKYLFLGFLPKKKGRATLFGTLADFQYPIVIFESPHRIRKTLSEIKERLGDRKVIIGRELTKKFQEIYRGQITEVLPKLREQGEFVLIIQNE